MELIIVKNCRECNAPFTEMIEGQVVCGKQSCICKEEPVEVQKR